MKTRPENAISYAEAARRLGCSRPTIPLMLKDGRLRRTVLPGMKKGCGVLVDSVNALLKGGAQ